MAGVKIKKFKFFFLILCVIQLFYIFHFRSGFKYEIIKNDALKYLQYSDKKFDIIFADPPYGKFDFFDIKKIDKNKVRDILTEAEKESQNQDMSDQAKYLVDHKIEVLKSLTLN